MENMEHQRKVFWISIKQIDNILEIDKEMEEIKLIQRFLSKNRQDIDAVIK